MGKDYRSLMEWSMSRVAPEGQRHTLRRFQRGQAQVCHSFALKFSERYWRIFADCTPFSRERNSA